MSLSSPGKCNCRCLALLAFKKNFWSFAFSSLIFTFQALFLRFQASFSRFQTLFSWFRSLLSRIWASFFKLDFCSFELYAFEASYFWASLFGFYHFEPYFVGSLYFFDLILTILGSCFQNTCSISVMSMWHILKQASWRIYNDNGCDIKLSYKAIERK